MMNSLKVFLFLTLFYSPALQATAPATGLAIHGTPKYQGSFTHLSYADPSAVKGGEISIGWAGSFDTLNAFSAKGISPLLLSGLVFQTLGQSTLDEPFSVYPELSESFIIAPDKLSMLINLNKAAKFSDGKPVTTQDVLFSFKLFRSAAVNAFYKSYWADIKEVEILSTHQFKFIFSKKNTELPAIAMQMTIFPKHIYEHGDFGKDFTDKAIGSGPYTVKKYKRGSFISYGKNPSFWARNSPFNKGKYNFDTITIKYYRDDTAQVEAFKKGDFDIYVCYSSQVWNTNLEGERFKPNYWIIKELWPHENNEGSQGFHFNLRRPIFQNPRVREAISLAFDFEWTNSKLFYGQYRENQSYFENSPLKATGLPEAAETTILKELAKKFPGEIPSDVFKVPMGGKYGHLTDKKRLRAALKMLKNEGYSLKEGVMESKKGGHRLQFRFLLRSQAMARVVEPFIANLKKIGVIVQIDMEEASVYQRKLQTRDFDMAVIRIGQSQSPGNEQIDFWHSSQAGEQYSRNYYGLKNKAVDEVIDRIIRAETRDDLILQTKILDRILYHLHISVHNWHSTSHRVAIWNRFSKPGSFPRFYLPFSFLHYLWVDPTKDKNLRKAMKQNKPLQL